MTCYSSKMKRPITFTLQFGRYFLDRMISPKWIGRAVSPLPPGHPLQRILHPFDFVFCGYTKDGVPPMPIILPKPARRTQDAAPTPSPVMLLHVWTLTQILCWDTHCALQTVQRRSQHLTYTLRTNIRYFSYHASSFLRSITLKSCTFYVFIHCWEVKVSYLKPLGVL